MANYKKAESTDEWLARLANGRLGEPIGCYQNPGSEGQAIGIFADGLAWCEGSVSVELRFVDLEELTPAHGKESEELLLKMHDGKQFRLSIKGRNGRFYDSMEMLRFLDRVMRDFREQATAKQRETDT